MFFEKFKEFPNKVQNQLGKTIKALQSDRGDEYLSQEFINHLKSYILEQKTLAETPQLNGVSELRNMTLLEMETKGYYFYNQTENKVFMARDVGAHDVASTSIEHITDLVEPIRRTNMDRPTTYKAATASPDSEKWLIAMKSKMESVKSIWILLAIASYFDYEIWQMDIKTTFLNSYLEKKMYMTQLEGFVDPRSSKKVCKLQRSHLWIKACIRSWNHRSDEAIKEFGFLRNSEEACVYKRLIGSNVVFLALYVDDILIIENKLESIKARLGKYFSMKDLEEAQYILGIRIYRNRSKRMA
ncbi:UNVERIFIED_CONTAM: Retrovirus-related Pol polyprotein from transposon RE1 [Sesamum calycinum]|uniref:Retrovirus-related Pol polyprotein from transposon RE1 n=1 Tax=Sesamum calycinum TaxID=2727403 RepID=A0AAW2KPL9_9LAMI